MVKADQRVTRKGTQEQIIKVADKHYLSEIGWTRGIFVPMFRLFNLSIGTFLFLKEEMYSETEKVNCPINDSYTTKVLV